MSAASETVISDRPGVQHRGARVERACENCGEAFAMLLSQTKNSRGLFCSKRCAYAIRTKRAQDRRRDDPPEDRFWRMVDRSAGFDACWPWLGAKDGVGYGTFRPRGRGKVGAHRFAYEVTTGERLGSLLACHRCDVPICVNPAHIFPGTRGDNARDMQAKGRQSKGEKHGTAKLTETDVRLIRRSDERAALLAKRFNVCKETVLNIWKGKTWRHIL